MTNVLFKKINGYCDFLQKDHSIIARYLVVYDKSDTGLELSSIECNCMDKCSNSSDCKLSLLAKKEHI